MKAAQLIAILSLACLTGCSAQEVELTSRPSDTLPTTRPGSVDHSALDRILRDSVRNQLVDYLNIRKRHWRGLNDYLERLSKIDLSKGSRDERLATLINLYNATMIKAVIERLHVDYSPSEREFVVFKESLVHTRNGMMSLNHLEHEIIRKHFQEPRVHVALVCGAKSCPPLLPRAYLARDLNAVLEDKMRAFVNDDGRNRIDMKSQRLQLSQVFNWYAQDFGGKTGLRSYLQRYTKQDLTGFKIFFVDYSWDLNLARPIGGKWVRTLDEKTPVYKDRMGQSTQRQVRKGSVFEVVLDGRKFVQVDDPLGGTKPWIRKLAVGPLQ